MYLRGTEEDEDPRRWIQDFEMRKEEKEWSDMKMATMFARFMAEGTLAEVWYNTLPQATKASYTLTRTELDTKWPKKTMVLMSSRKKQQRVMDMVLMEEEVEMVVEDATRGIIGAHVLWAEKLRNRALEVGDTNMLLYWAAKANFPRAIDMLLNTTELVDWGDFVTKVSAATTTMLKKLGSNRLTIDYMTSLRMSTYKTATLAQALPMPQSQIQQQVPTYSQPRYITSPLPYQYMPQQQQQLQMLLQQQQQRAPFTPRGNAMMSTPQNRSQPFLQQLTAATAVPPSSMTPSYRR